MNVLEFLERMALSIQYQGKEFTVDIVLNDNKCSINSVECQIKDGELNIIADQAIFHIGAKGNKMFDGMLDIIASDESANVVGSLLSAIIGALSVKLETAKTDIEGVKAQIRYIKLLDKLNDVLTSISGTLAESEFGAVDVTVDDASLISDIGHLTAEDISIDIHCNDENATIELTMYEAPAVTTSLSIELNDEQATIMRALYRAIAGALNVYIDITTVIDAVKAHILDGALDIDVNDELMRIGLTAYREAMLADYYLTNLETMGAKTLGELTKIYLEV